MGIAGPCLQGKKNWGVFCVGAKDGTMCVYRRFSCQRDIANCVRTRVYCFLSGLRDCFYKKRTSLSLSPMDERSEPDITNCVEIFFYGYTNFPSSSPIPTTSRGPGVRPPA